LTLPDRWILSRLARLAADADAALSEFRFDEMANALYQFLWHEYCDWYLEMANPHLAAQAAPADAARTRSVLLHVLESVLRLLHPVMPFLTEELWQRLPHEGESIALAPYPAPEEARRDDEAERRVALLMEIVGKIRNVRAELNIDPGRRLPLRYHASDDEAARTLAGARAVLITLARLEDAQEASGLDGLGPAARAVAAGVDLAVPLAGVLDVGSERRRLEREIEKLSREREGHA